MNTAIKSFNENSDELLTLESLDRTDKSNITKYKSDTKLIVEDYNELLTNINTTISKFNTMMTLHHPATNTEDLVILPDSEKRQLTQDFVTNTLSLADVKPTYMYNLIDLIYYQIFFQYFNELTTKLKSFNDSIVAIEAEDPKIQSSFNTLKTKTTEIYESYNIYIMLYNYLNKIILNELNKDVSPILIDMISRIKFEYDFDTLIEKAFVLLNTSKFNSTTTNYNKDLYLKVPTTKLNLKGNISNAIAYEKKRINEKEATSQKEADFFSTIKNTTGGLFITNFPENLLINKTNFDKLIFEGIIAHKLRVINTVNRAVDAAVDAKQTENRTNGRPIDEGVDAVRLVTRLNTTKTANSDITTSSVAIHKAVMTFYLETYLTPAIPTPASYTTLITSLANTASSEAGVNGDYNTFISTSANFSYKLIDGTTPAAACSQNQMINLSKLVKVIVFALVKSSIKINDLISSSTMTALPVSMDDAYTQINKIVSDSAETEVTSLITDRMFTGINSHDSGRDDTMYKNYIKEIVKLKYDQMNIDMNLTRDTIKIKHDKVVKDKKDVDKIIKKIDYDTNKTILLKYVNSIINMYYSQFITSINSLFISGNRLNKDRTKEFRAGLKSFFALIFELIKRKNETETQYNMIQSKLTNPVKKQLEKYHKLFIEAIMYPFEFESDNQLIIERVNKLNEIIKGAKYNPDEDLDPVEDDIEPSKHHSTSSSLIKSDGKPSVTEFDKIYEKIKDKSINETTIKQILQDLDKLVVSDEEIFRSIDDEGCFGLDGGQCIDLVMKCLQGTDKTCIDKFNSLNLNKDIDITTMSISKALLIAKKIGFLDMEVDEWYRTIYLPKYKSELSTGLLKVFKAMKRKINIYNGKPQGCDKSVIEEPRSTKMRMRYVASSMTGGGNKNNYNNFIINLTALKNNLSMSGGAGNSHSLFLDNLNYLKELLKNNGKELDRKSENNIIDVINKIQAYEKFLKKINHIITGFIYILDKTNFEFDPTDKSNPTITALSELLKKQELIQKKNTKRGNQLIGYYTSIPLPYLMPMIATPS